MWDTLATKLLIDNEIIRQWLIKWNISVYKKLHFEGNTNVTLA